MIVTAPEMCPRNVKVHEFRTRQTQTLQAKPAITRTRFTRVMMYDVGTD